MAEIVKEWKTGQVVATLKQNTLTISGYGYMYDYEGHSPWNNESITNIVIKDGVANIGKNAFRNSPGLRAVEIGNDVKEIGDYAFFFCEHLKIIKFGNAVKYIGMGAFSSCGITSITLPDSLITIGNNAFSSCKNIKEVKIPLYTESIGDQAFRFCNNLESFLIPENVRSLGYYILDFNSSFKTLINESVVPQRVSIDSSTLSHTRTTFNKKFCSSVILYVPASAIDLYKTGQWSPFKTILPIEELDNYDESFDVQIKKLDCRLADIKEEITKLEEEVISIEKQKEDLRLKKVLLRGLSGNPKHVAEFMALFNQRDGLKYLTHDIDGSENFDYNEVLSLVREVCTENFEEKELPSTLRELLNQFIFEENPQWKAFDKDYNELDVTSGWSAKDWMEVKNSNLHPIKQPQFAEVIRNFKRLTRIESPYLETLVTNVFSDESFKVETKDLSKADFYTHVGEFKAALETIFAEIQKRADSNEKKNISVAYKREISDDFFVRKIIITHHNSYPTRDDKDTLIKEWLSFEKGCMAKIAAHLQGYCHWSVETQIEGEPVRVNILREQETEPYESIDDANVDGFTHILTFYYQS